MRRSRLLVLLLAVWLVAQLAGPAYARAAANLSIEQYKHKRWTVEDGVPSPIYSIAQSKDGYLWLATLQGAFRFDGVRFERIHPDPTNGSRIAVQKVLAARDGSVWLAYREGGVAKYRNGALHDMGLKQWPSPDALVAMTEAADGSIWMAGYRDGKALARYRRGQWKFFELDTNAAPDWPANLLAARNGAIWLARERSIMVLRPGASRFERFPIQVTSRSALTEDDDGRIWLSNSSGTRVIDPVTPPGSARRFAYPAQAFDRARASVFDRNGNLWSADGITGLWMTSAIDPVGAPTRAAAEARVDRFGRAEGLASDNVTAVLADREGSVWIASLLGLDQLRPPGVVAEPMLTKLGPIGYSLFSAADGTVYVGQADSLFRVRPGGRPEALLHDVPITQVCDARDRGIWAALEAKMVLVRGDVRSNLRLPGPKPGIVFECALDDHQNLWISLYKKGGVYRHDAEGWHQISGSEGHGDSSSLVRDDSGRMIFAVNQVLFSCGYDGKCHRRNLKRYLGDNIINVIYAGRGYTIASSVAGILRIRSDSVSFISSDRFPVFRGTMSIVQTPQGETWLISDAGVVRLSTKALERAFDDPRTQLDSLVLSASDGLLGVPIRGGIRDAARGGDGRVWFATSAGVVWVDPQHLPRNEVAPNVAIASLTAGGATYLDPDRVRLPVGTASGEIDFAVLSFAIPQRNQVRYRLEGADAAWVDPGIRRQMFFSNLNPGTYRFRVIATNNDGVWNRKGAMLEITIPPTFVQSAGFKLLCALTIAALLWLAYSLRLRQVTGRLQATLEVKLAERERIARELHDTLLQGFQGLILRFQAMADRLPPGTPWRDTIYKELDHADAVLIAGRDQVSDVRASDADGDLAQSLLAAASSMRTDWAIPFDLTVEGEPRTLHPIVHQEVQRIGEEAMRNAFRHSGADLVRVSIVYHRRLFRLEVSDNGTGLPDDISTEGTRPHHFGLPGMRERAQRIGGTLTITSRRDAGTEIRLSVPGQSAYGARRVRWSLFRARATRAGTGS